MTIDKVDLLNVPFLKGLASDDLVLLSEMTTRKSFDKDTIIFSQGDRADQLYILMHGEVSIRYKPHDDEVIAVTSIEEGGVFGWSAALGRKAYTSSAIATLKSEALSIRGEDLHGLCLTNPKTGVVILERLAGVIAERLRNTHKHIIDLLWKGVNSSDRS
jgi:CRP-like cAMP-binding protein